MRDLFKKSTSSTTRAPSIAAAIGTVSVSLSIATKAEDAATWKRERHEATLILTQHYGSNDQEPF